MERASWVFCQCCSGFESKDIEGFKVMLRMSYGDFKRILAQIEELISPHQILHDTK